MLAGWIALRFKDRPAQALEHFQTLNSVVTLPVSLARGAYWSARAAEAMNDPALARRWYETAALYPTVFYGQLAVDRLGDALNALKTRPLEPSPQARTLFEQNPLVKAARILAKMGQDYPLGLFVRHLAQQADTPEQSILAASLGQDLERPQMGVIAAKAAVQDGAIMIENGYPVIALADAPADSHSLILSIARQESQFNPKAISHVGALGLMQLMPATANRMSRQLQKPYSRERLLSDPAYNLELGSTYFAQLLKRYDGAPMLALAAYNAGAGSVSRWLNDYGDPRIQATDPIDWIEMIPYSETRNYVQRVLEAAPVYALRLGDSAAGSDGGDETITLTSFLQRGRKAGPDGYMPRPKPLPELPFIMPVSNETAPTMPGG
ncbi:hypothetical protein JCM17845_11920 [Iodidimonas gelatinilytica]|uniref:Transglycosylase SLT domain-containing protein n=1 Tax=Iodidimonas gelatinilytica TaxID=1236966 RepID=A0A5A7N033_9PROT|nr:lytic transglycosylase domain-containing protein [Iodidimonas gelatinilytica]GER00569.1 hypothetical protein JCM17845_11920 [Iodidimonas gelatinilytica]